jgi:hypothetical protein
MAQSMGATCPPHFCQFGLNIKIFMVPGVRPPDLSPPYKYFAPRKLPIGHRMVLVTGTCEIVFKIVQWMDGGGERAGAWPQPSTHYATIPCKREREVVRRGYGGLKF